MENVMILEHVGLAKRMLKVKNVKNAKMVIKLFQIVTNALMVIG